MKMQVRRTNWVEVGRDFVILAANWLALGTVGSLVGTLVVFTLHRSELKPWLWTLPAAIVVALIFKFLSTGRTGGF